MMLNRGHQFNLPMYESHIALLLLIFSIFFKTKFFYGTYPFAPFIDFFWIFEPGVGYRILLGGITFLCCLGIVFRKMNRIACFILGLIILWIILSNQLFYSTNNLLLACLFILLGVYRGNDLIFRIQLSILYFGSSISKILETDWRNGTYFNNFITQVYDLSLINILLDFISVFWVALFFSWFVIGIEISLCVLVLFRRFTFASRLIALVFHGGMLIISGGELSVPYFYILMCAFLLLQSKIEGKVNEDAQSWFDFFIDYFKTLRIHFLKLWKGTYFQNNTSYIYIYYFFALIYIIYFRFIN